MNSLQLDLEQVYWCSRQQKVDKNKSHSSESTSLSSNSISVKTARPKEIKLFPIIPKLVQPNSPSLSFPSFDHNNYNGDTCSTAGSSSSSTAAATRKFRKKNLLER
jgi:hypothetical protein